MKRRRPRPPGPLPKSMRPLLTHEEVAARLEPLIGKRLSRGRIYQLEKSAMAKLRAALAGWAPG